MNICCSEGLDNVDLRKTGFKDDFIYLRLDKTILRFYENEGVFRVLDSDDVGGDLGNKKLELEELKKKIKKKDEEITFYELKLKDLDAKLANMEKVLLMDDKENQYIELLGENNAKN